MNTRVVDTYDQFLQQRGQPLSQNAAPDSLAQQRDNELKMNRFRQVVSRDLTTFIGLLQQFKLHDRNNNGTLEYGEFETIINEYNIGVQQADIPHLFKNFDFNGDGHVSFMELMRVAAGELTQYRRDRIELAWRRINPTQAPSVLFTDMLKHFNAS